MPPNQEYRTGKEPEERHARATADPAPAPGRAVVESLFPAPPVTTPAPDMSRPPRTDPATIPDGIDPQAWTDFERYRRQKARGKAMSADTRECNARKLRKLETPEQQRACVEMTIERGWTGLFPQNIKPEATEHAARPQHRRESETERRARTNARVIADGLKAAVE